MSRDRNRDSSPAAIAARAHRAKKSKPKKEVYDFKELRVAGRVVKQPDGWVEAGQRWRGAHRWIPISILAIQICCAIAIVASLASLTAILMRQPPVLFLAYPDGSIRCAPTPIDPATGKSKPRPEKERQQCAAMSAKFGE